MLPISVCRFARRRSCPGVSPQRFDSPWYALVAASCISLASVQTRKLVHSAAAPLPTKSPILRESCCRSWHTSPGDHIPAGRLFSCQGASPLTCLDWEGRFGGVFFKKCFYPSTCLEWERLKINHLGSKISDDQSALTCSDWEGHFGHAFFERNFFINPLTCMDWETCFGRVFSGKFLFPHLFPLGKRLFSGVLSKNLSLYLFPLGNPFCSGAFQKLLCENEKTTHCLGAWLKLLD